MSTASNRGSNVLEAVASGFVICMGLFWMLICILVVASPFILMLAFAYWLIGHA